MKRGATKNRILALLQKKDYSVSQLSKKLHLSPQIIHRHLKDLMAENLIGKKGRMPYTVYFLCTQEKSRVLESKETCGNILLDQFKHSFVLAEIPKKGKIDFGFLLTASAVYSSNIEGNTLDLNSFTNAHTLARHKQKEVREIEDLIEGYRYAQDHVLTEKNMLHVHKIITKELLSAARRGHYRQESVGVFGRAGLEYMALEHEQVTQEMSIFFGVIEDLLSVKMSQAEVFFWSLWIHLHFVLIHPFADGNGRMARLLEKWFIAQKRGKIYWSLQTEEYYWRHLDAYYASLRLGRDYWDVDFSKAAKFFLTK